jgi:hypothetical protein
MPSTETKGLVVAPDPTFNVRELVSLEVKRLNDLRAAETTRINELMSLRADYTEKLVVAEAKRIDAIRAVDVNAVAIANERSAAQAIVLANQVSTSAETLRALVATTAATTGQQSTLIFNQLIDRIASLEKAQYEGVGKGRVADPMMANLVDEVKKLRDSRSEIKGGGEGVQKLIGWAFAGIMALVAIGSLAIAFLKH